MRASTCSSLSSPPSATAPAWASPPRSGSPQPMAATSSCRTRRWEARACWYACRCGTRSMRRSPPDAGCAMSFTVLVVDDEKSFRVIAEEALSREGYAVRTADSGAAGTSAFRDEPPDVVILDRNLPDVDGVDLLGALSREAQERGVDTLFLVATAYADVENAVLALRQGADDYLTKPITLSELVGRIA